jgi:hypothetical protein
VICAVAHLRWAAFVGAWSAGTVSERIYILDGFVDADGTILAAAAAVKCMQLPRRSGPGVCFESAALDPDLLAGLQRLCRQSGFRGVFDAEFLIDGEDRLLIDFNARFNNHMAFEVERNLPLPLMSYLAAIGDERACETPSRSSMPSAPPTGGSTCTGS